jgi:serralysin
MATINAAQDREVTFLSGVNGNGIVDEISFGTWNYDSPATYDGSEGLNYSGKFGSATAGTGATISYAFDAASNWSAAEKAAFVATAQLWSAVANVRFVEAGGPSAQVTLKRTDEGSAAGGQGLSSTAVTGTNQLGVARAAGIEIDTSVPGFGPIGAALSVYGGAPYATLIHEWGHVLGLGHGGPYDAAADIAETRFGEYDSEAWTIMSYNSARNDGFNWGTAAGDDGYLYYRSSQTWMPLDILAIQRLYGTPVNTPLSGGQTYGFHVNIQGDIAKFFDFTLNSKPVVTLWNAGVGNTLDLSGFTLPSTVDLHDGAFSSAAGLTRNIAIAYGTRIDTLVTGFGADSITGNDNGNVIYAGGGADVIMGGSGNDHLYGAAATAISGDGNDTVSGGAGGDYIQGNAGEDRLDGGDGSDRIQGGQGNDSITGGAGNDSVNGNLGNDTIDGGADNDSLRGGQGNDSLMGGDGNDILSGDLGADTLAGGTGIDMLTGGVDADLFVFASRDAAFATFGPAAYATDTITDFTDGVDRIRLGIGIPTAVIQGGGFTDVASAANAAQQTLDAQGYSNIVALRVGGDTYIFYDAGASSPLEAIRLSGIGDPALIGVADFA